MRALPARRGKMPFLRRLTRLSNHVQDPREVGCRGRLLDLSQKWGHWVAAASFVAVALFEIPVPAARCQTNESALRNGRKLEMQSAGTEKTQPASLSVRLAAASRRNFLMHSRHLNNLRLNSQLNTLEHNSDSSRKYTADSNSSSRANSIPTKTLRILEPYEP